MKVTNSEVRMVDYDWRGKAAPFTRLRDVILPGLLGLAFGSVVGAYFLAPISIILVSGVIFIYFLFRSIRGGYKNTTIVIVFIISTLAGVARGEIENLKNVSHVAPESRRYEGVVVNSESGGRLTIDIGDPSGRVLLRVPDYPAHKYGEYISFESKLELPQDFRTDSGVKFHYRDFLRARGIGYIGKTTEVKILASDQGNFPYARLGDLRHWLSEKSKALREPEGALLRGILLGGSSELPHDTKQDFIASSLVHIVVLSGANLMFMAMIAMKIFRSLFGFRGGVICAGITTLLYAIMGGAEGATLRALVMVSFIFLGIYLKREAYVGRLLLVSCALLLIVNPYLLFDDPSFQLSVLAVVGLIYVSPIYEIKLIRRGVPLALAAYLAAIIGVYVFTLPLISWMSGQIALWGVLANFLVLGVIEFVAPLSLTLLLPKSLFAQVSQLPLDFLLSYVVYVAHNVSRLPLAVVTYALGVKTMICVYAVLVFYMVQKWRAPEFSPISIFTEKENERILRSGGIPWEPEHPTQGDVPSEKIIKWD
jgi:ComEC/Rec2-related protein